MRAVFALLIAILNMPAFAGTLGLEEGRAVTEENRDQLLHDSLPYSIARAGHRALDEYVVLGFLVTGDVVYSLSDESTLVKTQSDSRAVLQKWALKRWAHQYFSPAVAANYAELSTDYPMPFDYEYVAPGVGCLGETPLRFGDIEGDGQKELVIFLNNLFIMFSPTEGRTVFAEYLDESDWLNEQEMQDFYNTYGEETAPTAQYLSRFHADNDGFALAVRAYAKLFFGDFDEDGKRDIVAWRKSYRSNAGTNPTKGFTKIRDNWQHFERQGEEGYLPQETAPDVVKSWLVDADLTWSKGFPNRSECSGHEGELIPEMHDLLLNDPEVLK